MAHTRHTGTRHSPAGFAEWLDDRLLPILGPPPLGPYDVETPPTPDHLLCPLCGTPMAGHTMERDGAHAFIHCPGAHDTGVAETGRAA
ncbi:hypothetical protein [Leifsonia sp. Root112D2]|jgi:hypothetical protein|uniref:hypothetical protein n=1 Tax=Leifsonia sp. Root112D2 TaxID=1736426 RepID=UPI0006FDA1E3|nr:hypothetical protein [Leifsonia sp. Root112D2]KQV06935.1 hypothetical protein ASC63_06155 [Leifsonia sp. Root112D2]